MKVLNHLVNSIRSAANYNSEAETRPTCILWTDKERQWENVIERIKDELSELLIYGDYNPGKFSGPSIWLRVAMAGLIEGYTVPYGRLPIIYLPGVSRQDLRAVEQCSNELKPIAELQYQGVIWSQINSRDWTQLAYLKTKKGGLGLKIQQDDLTLKALERSMERLLDEDIENIKGEYLDKDFFNELITGGDSVKDILLWMMDSESFKMSRSQQEWLAFIDICKSKYKFDPEQDGIFGAAEKLAWKDDAWDLVWDRFCEAPAKYHAISSILRNTVMPIGENQERSPQWNEQQESILRKELKALEGMTEQSARNVLIRLENEHHKRRESIWAEIGEAPLVKTLYWLSKLADLTKNIINGSFSDISKAYDEWGWMVDDSVIRALTTVEKQEDIDSVVASIRSIYITWIDGNARILQKMFRDYEHPTKKMKQVYKENECVFFVDGLRFDLAKRLSEKLKLKGFEIKETVIWSQLPSVTATCKPALTPIAEQFIGEEVSNEDFAPILKETRQKASVQKIDTLMIKDGWSVLKNGNLDKEDALYGWFEFGHIDEDGHSMGWRMAYSIERYLNEVVEKIEEIFKAGWNSVKLVTDHGWLMIPQGFPKTSLSVSLVDSKWGRCAAIKQGALFDGSYYPWHWNENVHFALAEGVSCYRASMEYTHGGISLEECLLLNLEISSKQIEPINGDIIVTDITWKGMRCKVAVEGQSDGIKLDIRMKPAMPESSIVMGIKGINLDGIASVVVDDDSLEGTSAYIVLINENEKVVYQIKTSIGSGN